MIPEELGYTATWKQGASILTWNKLLPSPDVASPLWSLQPAPSKPGHCGRLFPCIEGRGPYKSLVEAGIKKERFGKYFSLISNHFGVDRRHTILHGQK